MEIIDINKRKNQNALLCVFSRLVEFKIGRFWLFKLFRNLNLTEKDGLAVIDDLLEAGLIYEPESYSYRISTRGLEYCDSRPIEKVLDENILEIIDRFVIVLRKGSNPSSN